PFNYWVALENILLNMLNYVRSDEFRVIHTEVYLAKRILLRYAKNKTLESAFKNLFSTLKQAESNNKAEFIGEAEKLQKEDGLFGLVNFNQVRNDLKIA